ncbi:MAG: hypothetical protein ONB46_25165 [candidate division KSB1 bacterium]|nr:hypothetical protein [candidate division KSB1 bacterium]MDZ7369179.1 hypothetical protein [candidate division KSB1 bacterium]
MTAILLGFFALSDILILQSTPLICYIVFTVKSNIAKHHGASPFDRFLEIIQLPFAHQSFYHDLIAAGYKGLCKDTIYALLNNPFRKTSSTASMTGFTRIPMAIKDARKP